MTGRRLALTAIVAWSVAAGARLEAAVGQNSNEPAADAPPSPTEARLREHPRVARVLEWIDALHERGIYPAAGTIVSGSGLAFGSGFRSPTWGRSGVSVEVDAMWSVRGYRAYGMQFGLLTRRRRTVTLRSADAEIGRAFDLPASAAIGLSVYVDARHRTYGHVDYFGVGGADAPAVRSDFSLTSASADLVAQWQVSPALGVSGRLGVLDLDVGPGRHSGRPNVDEVFDERTAPGLNGHPRYRVSAVGLAYDRRDQAEAATRGMFLGVAARYFQAIGATSPSVLRLAFDLRVHRAIASNHVIAVNVLGSADRTRGSMPPPFHLQSWIGGSRTLRGLPNYRLRGESLAHVAIEYRWRAGRFVEVAPFIDMGTVSGSRQDLRDEPLHRSLGAGLRLRSDDRVLVRLDWATSDGDHRIVLSLSPSF